MDRRSPFPDPAKELEFNLVCHGLRIHYDSLMMISTSLRLLRAGGSGAAQLAREIEGLCDRICADVDALDALLPESLDAPDDAGINTSQVEPLPPGRGAPETPPPLQ